MDRTQSRVTRRRIIGPDVPRFEATDIPGVRRYELAPTYGEEWLEAVNTGVVIEVARVRQIRAKEQRAYLQRPRMGQERRVQNVSGSFDEADVWLQLFLMKRRLENQ